MIWQRDRYISHCLFEYTGREMFCEMFGPLYHLEDEPRQLLGEENLCCAYYDEPEMLEDMMATFTDTALRMIERVGDVVPIDNLIIHEDMAGKSGPLIGPGLVEKFIAPSRP